MKVSLAILALLFLTTSAMAQDVPVSVEKAFAKKFVKVESVVWDMNDDGSYVAIFMRDGTDMSVQYTAEGGWLSTTTYIELTDIPENVQKILSRKFPEYDVYDISRVETAGGRYFEAMLESEDDALLIQINEDGSILKKEAIAIDLE